MALRAFQTRDENVTRLPPGKAFHRADIKPRAALSTLGNTALDKHAPGKVAVKKAFAVPTHNARFKAPNPNPPHATVPITHPPPTKPPTPHHPPLQDDFPEPEEMEVGQITAAFSQQLVIENIDENDRENPQLCAEYVKEIYEYMRELEGKFHVEPTYIANQVQINAKMRAILIDWLIQVHLRFTLLQETLYLTVSIIDRYLQAKPCDKSKLQLVGVTAMLIASKYEEMYAPEVRDFVYITDNTYTSEQIRAMERDMLRVMDYSLGAPLCLHFLRRYSRAGNAGPDMHTMAKFLMELSLTDYPSLKFVPSQLAAAALYIACKICGDGEWTPTLQHYSTYSELQILPCVRRLAHLVTNMATSKQQAVKKKYSSSKFLKVALDKGLQSQVIRDLAAADSTR